jgi:hypothetical protein
MKNGMGGSIVNDFENESVREKGGDRVWRSRRKNYKIYEVMTIEKEDERG